MRLYDAARPCAKCGSTSVGTFYRPPFRMERRCGRCSHVWFEKPLDTAEKPLDAAEKPLDVTEVSPTKGIDTEDIGTKGIGVFRLNPRD